jgi:hypothetical protein
MVHKILAVGLFGSVALLAIICQYSTPATIGPMGILVVFILMYVAALCVLTFLIYGLNILIVKITSTMIMGRPVQRLSLRRAYYFASVIALAPVMVIGMQSVGSVGLYELLLVVFFLVIACVYIAKRTQ